MPNFHLTPTSEWLRKPRGLRGLRLGGFSISGSFRFSRAHFNRITCEYLPVDGEESCSIYSLSVAGLAVSSGFALGLAVGYSVPLIYPPGAFIAWVSRFRKDPMGQVKASTKNTYRSLLRSMGAGSWVLTNDGRISIDGMVAQTHIHSFFLSSRTLNTKKTACAALKYLYQELSARGGENLYVLEKVLLDSKGSFEPVEKSVAKKKTGKRARKISEADLQELCQSLESRSGRSTVARQLLAWIKAAEVTGARPIEWIGAHWSTMNPDVLILPTAKEKLQVIAKEQTTSKNFETFRMYAESRIDQGWIDLKIAEATIGVTAFPGSITYRYIPVDKRDRADVETHIVELHKVLGNSGGKVRERLFRTYYDSCRKFLNRICKEIWRGEKAFCLYTFRSQFAANMKALHGDSVTRLLMGHSKHSNSPSFYGNGNQAHSAFKGRRPAQYSRNQLVQHREIERPRERG